MGRHINRRQLMLSSASSLAALIGSGLTVTLTPELNSVKADDGHAHNLETQSAMLVLLTAIEPSHIAVRIKSPKTAYEHYKEDLLANCVDKYGLVTLRKLDDGQGDSPWRTGLTSLALSIEGDVNKVCELYSAVSKHCWSNGVPIRHPEFGDKESYSRDQLITLLASYLVTWESFNNLDRPKARLARQLAKRSTERYLNYLLKNKFVLGKRGGSWLTPMMQWSLWEVARRMNLSTNWIPLDFRGMGRDTLNGAKKKLDDQIKRIFDRDSDSWKQNLSNELRKQRVSGHSLPKELRDKISTFVVKQIQHLISTGGDGLYSFSQISERVGRLLDREPISNGVLSPLPDFVEDVGNTLNGLTRKTIDRPLDQVKDQVKKAINRAIANGMTPIIRSVSAGLCTAQVQLTADSVRGKDDANQFYRFHLLFWTLFTINLTVHRDVLAKYGVDDSAHSLHLALKRHRMALFYWLAGGSPGREVASKYLSEWPEDFNHLEYAWQESIKSQRRRKNKQKDGPFIDYMILYQLCFSKLRTMR